MATRKPTAVQIAAAFALIFAQTGINNRDKVKLVRWPTEDECKINKNDLSEIKANLTIGETYEVTDTCHGGDVELNEEIYLPFTCLEKIGESNYITVGDEEGEVSDDGKYFEVGCQTISFEEVEKVYNKMKANQAEQAAKAKPATTRRR